MKYKIYRIENAEDVSTEDGKAVPYLTYEKPNRKCGDKLIGNSYDATLEELVQFCDQDAANYNAHAFCGSHRLLGALLNRHLGRILATEIMLEIAERGGQHGMGGVCKAGDSYRELGVGKAGQDWDGSYPA